MKKLVLIIFIISIMASCARKVVTVDRVLHDTVTVERVAHTVEVQRDTVTIERVIEGEQQRVELDTAGRVRVVVKTIFRDNGKTSAGSVVERVVHDTIKVQAEHSDINHTKVTQNKKSAWPYVVIFIVIFAFIMVYFSVKRIIKV